MLRNVEPEKNPRKLFQGTRGYVQRTGPHTQVFVPEEFVTSFNPDTGELFGCAPDYEAMESEKAPAVTADKPGEYSYYYETQHAPVGCDFSAELAYYGEHYYLRPLHEGLPKLHGRGITYDERSGSYCVTLRAYEKLKEQYKIRHEICFD